MLMNLSSTANMVMKQLLAIEAINYLEGNVNEYRPAVGKEPAIDSEIRRFVDEVVGTDEHALQLLRRIVEERALLYRRS